MIRGYVHALTYAQDLSGAPSELLSIANKMQEGGVEPRSLAEPIVGVTSSLAEPVLATIRLAEKLAPLRDLDRTGRGRATAKAQDAQFGLKFKLAHYRQRGARAHVGDGKAQHSVALGRDVSQAIIGRLAP